MKEKLFEKLTNSAVENIEKILDPIEKVKAIVSILPYISKDTVVESDTNDVKAIAKQVEQKVAENIINMEQPKVQPQVLTVPEQPVMQAPAPQPVVPADEEIVVKANETAAETSKRLELIVKKYGNMTLNDFCQSGFNYLNNEFGYSARLKQSIENFLNQYYPQCGVPADALLGTYMQQCEPENTAIQGNILNTHVKAYVEKFYPVIAPLNTIYSSDPNTISKVITTVSNGIYKDIGGVNIDNAKAFSDAIEAYMKQAQAQ